LSQAIDVGLTSAEVATLDRVIEQTENRVAITLIVLGGIDATLGCDGMSAPGAILDAETILTL
jgi:hypothetical protein